MVQLPLVRAFQIDVLPTIRLSAIYLIGTCFGLFWREIEPWLNGRTAAASGFAALVLIHSPYFAEAGLTTFGAAALFWVALKARLGSVQRINDRWDISYGVYLYGWPVATYFCWRTPDMSPWLLTLLTLAIAAFLGAASWWGVERYAKRLRLTKRWASPPPTVPTEEAPV